MGDRNKLTPEQNEKLDDLINIEIWRKRRIWEPFMRKHNCQRIAELGVQFGHTFGLMTRHEPEVAVAVDAWSAHGTPGQNDWNFDQVEMERQYNDFMERVKDKPFAKVYRGFTHDVVKHFPDEYFDVIYIDADHTYEGCKRDIEDWYPKVKKGGCLTGDDYRKAYIKRSGVTFGVKEAVNEFAKNNNLERFELPRYGWAILK